MARNEALEQLLHDLGITSGDLPDCDRPGEPHHCPGMHVLPGQDIFDGLKEAFGEDTALALFNIMYKTVNVGPLGPAPWAWVWH